MLALVVSFVFHLVNIILYWGVDDQGICDGKPPRPENDNQLYIGNSTELAIRWVQNIAELFPHIMIPFIFWYLPTRISRQSSTIYVLMS